MTAIKSTCYFVPPENLEVSVGVAGVSKDWAFFNISQAGTPVHILGLPLELSTTHLKMDSIVKFYITFFQNSKVSPQINPL